MLMLSRSPGKAIIIGGNIRVYVAQVTGLQVRLGIDAPKGVVVDREEIHARRTVESEARLAGRTEAEVVAAKPTGEYDAKVVGGPESADRFVRQIYTELKPAN